MKINNKYFISHNYKFIRRLYTNKFKSYIRFPYNSYCFYFQTLKKLGWCVIKNEDYSACTFIFIVKDFIYNSLPYAYILKHYVQLYQHLWPFGAHFGRSRLSWNTTNKQALRRKGQPLISSFVKAENWVWPSWQKLQSDARCIVKTFLG